MGLLIYSIGMVGTIYLTCAVLFGIAHLFYLIWPPIKKYVIENIRFWL